MIFIQRVIWVFVLSPDQFLRVKKKVDHLKLGMPEGNMYCLYIQYSQKASNNLVLIKLYLIKNRDIYDYINQILHVIAVFINVIINCIKVARGFTACEKTYPEILSA